MSRVCVLPVRCCQPLDCLVSRCDASVTWKDLRVLKSFFHSKGNGTLSVSEKAVRQRCKEIDKQSVLYESGTIKIDETSDSSVSFIRCVDVSQLFAIVLNERSAANQLHKRLNICNDDLRITVIGDKGGKQMKIGAVIWDVVESQSPYRSILLGMYEGADDYSALDRMFANVFHQLSELRPPAILPSPPSFLVPLPSGQPTLGGVPIWSLRNAQRRHQSDNRIPHFTVALQFVVSTVCVCCLLQPCVGIPSASDSMVWVRRCRRSVVDVNGCRASYTAIRLRAQQRRTQTSPRRGVVI